MKDIKTVQIDLFACRGLDNLDTTVGNYFLEKLIEYIQMRKIPEEMIGSPNPCSFEFFPEMVGLEGSEKGFTGIAIMMESHVAYHSWNDLDFVTVTICSCKDFCPYNAAKFCSRFFDAGNYIIKLIN